MAVWSTFVNHGPCYVGLDASTRRDLTEIAANIKQAEEMGTFRSIDLLLGCVFSACTHIALHDPFFQGYRLLHHIAIAKPQPSVFLLYQAFNSRLSALFSKPGLRFQQTIDYSQIRSPF